MGLILFIVSLILVGIVTAISFVVTPIYYIITFKWKNGSKQLNKWFGLMALSFDQFGNVTCKKVLDLTGAGDLFAAGFLKEYLDKSDIKKCLTVGSIAASKIIQKIGARIE